jgi:putative acyl-CoA dehydrogenase
MPPTHRVLNQPPPLVGYDLFATDPFLGDAVEVCGAGSASTELSVFGKLVGSAEVFQWGFDANRFPPRPRTHDPYGHRVDEVEYHPSWHRLLDLAVTHGLHSLPWEDRKAAQVTRAALTYMSSQVEAGHWCPISMTASAVPALRVQPEVAAEWEPLLLSRHYDGSSQPASKKTGVLLGMGMTEKQGGSDVRANLTSAVPVDGGGPGGEYLLTGHKWFCSAPMSDAFLMLAQAPSGLSCFLVPRWTQDGERNTIHLQRLKDKLGNRSNASSEIELDGARGLLIGEEGRGVPTIIEMVAGTRLDCVTGSAALMRQAVSQAAHHAAHRSAFGRTLIDQALMVAVLADLEIETEAAVAMMVRVAACFDAAPNDPAESALRRIITPIAKYWVTKRAPPVVGEALECLGGNGYVEESIMPRLYREAPLNSIWEGSGNVICLDVLRALSRDPETVDVLLDEVAEGAGADRRLAAAHERLRQRMAGPIEESEARRLVEQLALAVQGSLLVRWARPEVADAFCASRLEPDHGLVLGALRPDPSHRAIAAAAVPSRR